MTDVRRYRYLIGEDFKVAAKMTTVGFEPATTLEQRLFVRYFHVSSLICRCSFNVAKMAQENELMLAGAQTFKIAADPYAIISKMKAGYKTEAEACSLLRNFKEEGNPMIETSDDPSHT